MCLLPNPEGASKRFLNVKPFIIIQPVDFCDFPLIRSTADAAAKIHYSIVPYCMCDCHAMQCLCSKRQSHETGKHRNVRRHMSRFLASACFVCLHDLPRRTTESKPSPFYTNRSQTKEICRARMAVVLDCSTRRVSTRSVEASRWLWRRLHGAYALENR